MQRSVNAINWESLDNLPLQDASEHTYFVLEVGANGSLIGGDIPTETKFVKDVQIAGKKATFSIAGSRQIPANIKSALTTNRATFINNIVARINQMGYSGVTLDIEHTHDIGLAQNVIPDFINQLKTKIGPDKIIGMYSQPQQLTTSHAKLELAKDAISWCSVMVYDAGPYNRDNFINLSRPWAEKVGKDKYLGGVAVNYATTDGGLNTAQFSETLDIAIAEGWKGIGIWRSGLYTQPWIDVRRAKFPNIF